MKKRIFLLGVLVHPALFWCAGSWNLTGRQLSRLRAVQSSMLRKMLTLGRAEGESLEDFMHRSNGIINNVRLQQKYERWDRHYFRLYFSWAGHVARLVSHDPERLTLKVLNYKSWAWIQSVAENNSGNQLHCRRLRTWRWERGLCKYDRNWQTTALDKQLWQTSLNGMVSWSSFNR